MRTFFAVVSAYILRTRDGATLRPYMSVADGLVEASPGGVSLARTQTKTELGSRCSGDGVELARGFPQCDVGFQLTHHFVEAGEVEGLSAIADGFFRMGVDLHNDAVGSDGHCGTRDCRYQAALARRMARVGTRLPDCRPGFSAIK